MSGDLGEPHITVNGQMLSIGQTMAVRVAITTFLLDLQDEEFMQDLGDIGPLYRARLIEVSKLMMRTS